MNDAVIHGAAMQRMRVQQKRRGGIRALGMMIAPFKPAIRPGEHYFWHGLLLSIPFLADAGSTHHRPWGMGDANPAAAAPHLRETKTHDQDTPSSLTCRPRKS
jgi:hypothetical protein